MGIWRRPVLVLSKRKEAPFAPLMSLLRGLSARDGRRRHIHPTFVRVEDVPRLMQKLGSTVNTTEDAYKLTIYN